MRTLKLAFIIALALPFYASASEKTIVLTTGEYPPYSSKNPNEPKIAEQIVISAFKKIGYEVVLKHYPTKRAYKIARDGEAHGTFPWFKTEDREKRFIYPSNELITETEVFFHRKDLDFNWGKYSDLKSYKIGGTVGYNSIEILNANDIWAEMVTDGNLNFKKLLAKRIDIYSTSIKQAKNT